MSTDLALVIGIFLGVMTIPAILSAILDNSAPRVAAFTGVAAGALIVYAVYNKPGGYAFSDLPDVFVAVFAVLIR
jgi:uncharacterized membrane protein